MEHVWRLSESSQHDDCFCVNCFKWDSDPDVGRECIMVKPGRLVRLPDFIRLQDITRPQGVRFFLGFPVAEDDPNLP